PPLIFRRNDFVTECAQAAPSEKSGVIDGHGPKPALRRLINVHTHEGENRSGSELPISATHGEAAHSAIDKADTSPATVDAKDKWIGLGQTKQFLFDTRLKYAIHLEFESVMRTVGEGSVNSFVGVQGQPPPAGSGEALHASS